MTSSWNMLGSFFSHVTVSTIIVNNLQMAYMSQGLKNTPIISFGWGVSNMFYFHPEPWGRCHFSMELKPPTSHFWVEDKLINRISQWAGFMLRIPPNLGEMSLTIPKRTTAFKAPASLREHQLGGGNSNMFYFHSPFGEDSHFDEVFPNGLVHPPTS